MIQATRERMAKHKWGITNLAAYSALIIFGINYFTEHGKLQSDVKWCELNLESESTRANEAEDKWEKCIESKVSGLP